METHGRRCPWCFLEWRGTRTDRLSGSRCASRPLRRSVPGWKWRHLHTAISHPASGPTMKRRSVSDSQLCRALSGRCLPWSGGPLPLAWCRWSHTRRWRDHMLTCGAGWGCQESLFWTSIRGLQFDYNQFQSGSNKMRIADGVLICDCGCILHDGRGSTGLP